MVDMKNTRQVLRPRKREEKRNGGRQQTANLYIQASFFYREHVKMHQKQPRNDKFGLLN